MASSGNIPQQYCYVWLCVVNVLSWHQSNAGYDLRGIWQTLCINDVIGDNIINTQGFPYAWCLYSYPDNFRECDCCDVTLYYYLQILRCSRLHSWSVLCGIIKTCDNVYYVIAACLSCLLLRAHRYIILTNLVQSTIYIQYSWLSTPVCIFPLNWILKIA